MFEADQEKKFYYSSAKLIRPLVVFAMMFGIGILSLFVQHPPPLLVLSTWICLIAGGLLGTMTLRQLLTRAPALVLSPQGVKVRYLSDTVPWSAITKLSEVSTKNAVILRLAVDPAYAQSVPRPWYTLQRGGKLSLGVAISQIDTAGTDIAQLCRSYMAAHPKALDTMEEQAGRSLPSSATQPFASYGLIVLLAVIYCAELAFAVDSNQGGSPSTQTLIALGGMFGSSIWAGQWWRLVTATLMHASLAHLLGNSFALWRAGVLLEGLVGRLWFLALFALCAVGGEVASLFVTPANTVGVGASGGIVGLFATAIVFSFHFRSSAERTLMQTRALSILVPAVLPLFAGPDNGLRIDYSAHIGGAVVGAVLALALMLFWSRDQGRPRYTRAAGAVAGIFALIAVGALVPITRTYAAYQEESGFAAFFDGRYADAVRLFGEQSELPDVPVAYYDLWRIMAMAYAKDPRLQAQAQQAQAKLAPETWPYPIFDLFTGKLSPEALQMKAAGNDQLCEATFYSAEENLIEGHIEIAKPLLKNALSICPKTFFEFGGAQLELRRLREDSAGS
ncbi:MULTISPECIES: rhomboid family intramembrane serine protease [unclassified Mesorhizobium]|uniref:rhomboid family intramembrane serine protease n=1 Tax=unclassified Mesorhizobium TaxID=325217 RepID=UPI000FD804A9|nr:MULTISPECIES: rhomboid family intramembrane serine protease [unclassified Mesorhizobium]TGQ11794.1 rhomboid family intramembrane serine protease [Mesorhizobium sp. M2E.F.Ca.ET.219.01.1.1]TGT70431.1 rhomboid family intramembrane serine protease [Mesorhizobium sp. M2E.F.Ca.ET.166.01.1.1]TGV98666.1 rhomboid family intramembrane serine protease [Mesorhizobium sp. M2E.F.Ca.ET.154.01.1.1]